MQTFLNGQPTNNPILLDRALHYGDGLFETIAIRSPIQNILQHPLWAYHIKRLQHGCDKLFFPPLDVENLNRQLNDFLATALDSLSAFQPWILKVILTRGTGQRGYAIPEVQQPNFILIQAKWPNYSVDYSSLGIDSEFSKVTLYPEPNTAGIKHLNRLTQVLASQQMSPHCQEALLLNSENFVIEGVKTNLFAVISGQLCTPCLKQQGILGVARAWILDYCKQAGISVKILSIHKTELLDAEQVFVCNSVIGIWPIAKLENKQFSIGDLSLRLQNAWGQNV